MTQTIPTAEPFFFPGSGQNARKGCLVQHGFTGTPKEVRWLGEYLNRSGYTVYGMRLAGHAITEEPKSEQVFQAAADFIARVSRA